MEICLAHERKCDKQKIVVMYLVFPLFHQITAPGLSDVEKESFPSSAGLWPGGDLVQTQIPSSIIYFTCGTHQLTAPIKHLETIEQDVY